MLSPKTLACRLSVEAVDQSCTLLDIAMLASTPCCGAASVAKKWYFHQGTGRRGLHFNARFKDVLWTGAYSYCFVVKIRRRHWRSLSMAVIGMQICVEGSCVGQALGGADGETGLYFFIRAHWSTQSFTVEWLEGGRWYSIKG